MISYKISEEIDFYKNYYTYLVVVAAPGKILRVIVIRSLEIDLGEACVFLGDPKTFLGEDCVSLFFNVYWELSLSRDYFLV